MNFIEAKATQAKFNAAVDAASAALQSYPKTGPFGMVPDHVRVTAQYRTAKSSFDRAFAKLRQFNGWFVKAYANELRAERAERRAA